MNKINNYLLVTEMGTDDLQVRVSNLILEGWQPLGGISSVCIPQETKNILSFSQVMVKYDSGEITF